MVRDRITFKVGEWSKGTGMQILDLQPDQQFMQDLADAYKTMLEKRGYAPVTITIELGVECSVLVPDSRQAAKVAA